MTQFHRLQHWIRYLYRFEHRDQAFESTHIKA